MVAVRCSNETVAESITDLDDHDHVLLLTHEGASFMCSCKLEESSVEAFVFFCNCCHSLSVHMCNLCGRSMLCLVLDPLVKHSVSIPVDAHILKSTPEQSAVHATRWN